MKKEPVNVFIATTPRSGSTLLGMILDQHKDVYHAGESFFWGKLKSDKASCPCNQKPCLILKQIENEIKLQNLDVEGLFNTCSMCSQPQCLRNSYVHLSIPDFNVVYSNDNWNNLDKKINLSCQTLTQLAKIFRKTTKKDIIVDNTKVIQIGEKLLKDYDWKIILLTRDARGTLNSNKNLAIRKKRPIQINLWVEYYKQFARHAIKLIQENENNFFWVKYEDLCCNPQKTIRDTCDFIGIEPNDEMINFKKQKGHTIMGNRMRFDQNNNYLTQDLSWTYGLDDTELKLILQDTELINLYGQLGYNIKRNG